MSNDKTSQYSLNLPSSSSTPPSDTSTNGLSNYSTAPSENEEMLNCHQDLAKENAEVAAVEYVADKKVKNHQQLPASVDFRKDRIAETLKRRPDIAYPASAASLVNPRSNNTPTQFANPLSLKTDNPQNGASATHSFMKVPTFVCLVCRKIDYSSNRVFCISCWLTNIENSDEKNVPKKSKEKPLATECKTDKKDNDEVSEKYQNCPKCNTFSSLRNGINSNEDLTCTTCGTIFLYLFDNNDSSVKKEKKLNKVLKTIKDPKTSCQYCQTILAGINSLPSNEKIICTKCNLCYQNVYGNVVIKQEKYFPPTCDISCEYCGKILSTFEELSPNENLVCNKCKYVDDEVENKNSKQMSKKCDGAVSKCTTSDSTPAASSPFSSPVAEHVILPKIVDDNKANITSDNIESYASTLKDAFTSMKYSDVIFLTNDSKKVFAHRCIIYSFSDIFTALFDQMPQIQNEIEVDFSQNVD
uniref:BTB domain-containing protein n=1 Tax=Panagrolaimus superbus TaxID=310955 RepID=A0A914Y1B7_9BILA